jgi:hypothetical protein
MALAHYPYRIEELSGRGEIGRILGPRGLPGSRRAVSANAHSATQPRADHGGTLPGLKGGTSPPAVALKAIDNPHSDCSAIRRFKVQSAIRARQHRSGDLRGRIRGPRSVNGSSRWGLDPLPESKDLWSVGADVLLNNNVWD